GDDRGHAHEDEGGADALAEQFGHGAARRRGGSEVADEESSQPGQIPQPGRLVEAELFVECGDPLGRGLLAEDGSGGVAGQQQGGAKDEQRDGDEDEGGEDRPAYDAFSEHVTPFRSTRGRTASRSGAGPWSWAREIGRASCREGL